MPRESSAALSARTQKIIAALRETYPEAHCELNFSTPLELLVATILSAQCTDKQVNLVTADLFPKYRSAADYAQADPAAFEFSRLRWHRGTADKCYSFLSLRLFIL